MKENRSFTNKSRGIVVLGMHRSGTSTVSGILNACGAWLGTSEEMTGANKENPKGFFERRDLRKICDSLLFAQKSDWWRLSNFNLDNFNKDESEKDIQEFSKLVENLSKYDTWVIKEPRLCILFPLLQQKIKQPICILPKRNPIEIAKSLRTRNSFSIMHGIALWELYTRSALLASEGHDRIFVSYSELIEDPEFTIKNMITSLEELGVEGISTSNEAYLSVSQDLQRESSSKEEMTELLDKKQIMLWKNVCEEKNLDVEAKTPISKRTLRILEDLEIQHEVRLSKEKELKDVFTSLNNIEKRAKQIEDNFIAELESLQSAATESTQKPLKAAVRNLYSKVLYSLSKKEKLFSRRRREKLYRSALKRNPKRDAFANIATNFSKRMRLLDFEIASSLNEKKSAQHIESFLETPKSDNPSTRKITVIVPIYNAADDLEKCISRLFEFTPNDVDILLIDDASSDPRIKQILEHSKVDSRVRILRNSVNLGFTRTVNRGLTEANPNDVIILNSDARVTPRWIYGIQRAVRSTSKVATVTPMSDRAGAFSAPHIGNENILPSGVDEITYSRAFRRRGKGSYPSVPTGNGYCMFISRACLEDVGNLDETAFPTGYGEENDFCMRAKRAGWKNLVDDRTYVFHSRSMSFGEAKNDLIAAGRRIIDERYPEYKRAIQIFENGPDLQTARSQALKAQIDCTKPNAQNRRILFVISTITGGTPQTNSDLMAALHDHASCFLLRCDRYKMQLWAVSDNQKSLLKEHELEEAVDPVSHCSLEYDQVLADWLELLDLDIVHIRHPAWHSLSLFEIASQQGRAVVMSFHDYYTLCPSVKLVDDNHVFCGGKCTAGPGDCRIELWPQDSMPKIKNDWVHIWRKRFSSVLQHCDYFITTSDDARKRLLDLLPVIPEDRFKTIPHGRDFLNMQSIRQKPSPDEPIRILVPGNINEAKGSLVLEDILKEDKNGIFEFHILGKIKNSTFRDDPRVIHHGAYSRDDFAEKAAKTRPHLGIVFSIWDETWCHTLTEMWSVGLPVAVLDFPTVAGRVSASGAGWVLNHRDIPKLCSELARVAQDKNEFERTEAAILTWQRGEGLAGSTKKMAVDYIDVYNQASENRRSKAL